MKTTRTKQTDFLEIATEKYNVVWNRPSKDSSGSMPVGNGDIGLNVWIEEDGDLLFYISKNRFLVEHADAAFIPSLGKNMPWSVATRNNPENVS